MKSLPLSELEVVAMIYAADRDDEGRTIFEMEFLNEELRTASAFEDFSERCDCCGQRLKYACEVVHVSTKVGYYVGRSCASKIESLRYSMNGIEGISLALAERAACSKREKAFRLLRPDACMALDWAATDMATHIASDMLGKLRRWGSLSDAQVSFLCKMHTEHLNKLAIAATGVKCPTGRVTLRGKIVSLKDRPEPARYGGTIHHWKMVLDLGNGVRVWGTCPEVLTPTSFASTQCATVGDTVEITATVKPSDKDPLFGYFSRPTKSALVSKQPQAVQMANA